MNTNYNTGFHPSIFESTSGHVPQDTRTLLSIREQRGQNLTSKDEKMKSPGRYLLTDNDNELSGSNTKHLFKNLYGETPLTFLFFSKSNIESIQNLIRFLVHRETGQSVDKQSYNELMIIMRSIFLEYSAHPALLDPKMSDAQKEVLLAQYTKEVERLNDIVINQIVPKVISQLQQYMDYLRDVNRPAYRENIPANSSDSGQRQYRSITQVLIGGDL
jgi:hypothetical protein